MLQLNHITKCYGAQRALNDVSLSIPDGQIVGLLGPNGAGKSTLMRAVMGLIPTEGTIVAPERKGYLPERNPLYDDMYVAEYLEFMSRISGNNTKGTVPFVQSLIDQVGLTPEAHKRIGELSKGYRQRVGLAQALIGDPELLILDEPTTGLDPNQLRDIRELIRSLTADRHRIVILSTHIMQEVQAMCDRVIILDHGTIRADRPLAEIADLEAMFSELTHNP